MYKSIALLLLSSVMIGTSSSQEFDRTKQPESGSAPSLALPAIQRASLPNGLQIMVVEQRELPVVNMQIVFRTGAGADPLAKAGVANLTASMLDEGTEKRTTLQIADEIDFLGAQLSISANFDGSFMNVLTLKEHLDKAADIFSDVILHCSFPQSEFDRVKKELLTSFMQQKDRPEVVASVAFNARLYGKHHPYGYQSAGSEESVQGIQLEDLKNFYATYFVPNNATLIVVGDVTRDEAAKLADRYFGEWQKKDVARPSIPAPLAEQATTIGVIDKPGAPQSQIRIGNIAIERNSDDYYATSILNQIIGASNGRLFLNLREAKGYTYGAYAQFAMRRMPGPFIAYAGVRTNVTDSSLIEFMYEINRVRDELVPEDEFHMYKRAVIQRIPRLFETSGQICNQLASLVLYGLPDDYFNSLVQRYESVTREDIRNAARKYLHPQSLTIVVVGDMQNIAEKLKSLNYGPVINCSPDGAEVK